MAMRTAGFRFLTSCSGCAVVFGAGCGQPSVERPAEARQVQGRTTLAMPSVTEVAPREYPGIHNAVAFHDGFVSGSAPEGDAGFATLAAMGVRTIISVDGAEPEAERAAAFGMRYIHLPIGYNGFDESRRLELARAARDARREGPVYIHCHHGKHRSAGAAAAIASSLGWLTPEQGVARMRISGTAPTYTGLYECAAAATVVKVSAIDAIPGDFPAVSRPSGFVQGMVEIDEAFEHLKLIEKAGWRPPPDHPDLVPPAEAGRLADHFRTLAAGEYARRKPAEFLRLMEESRAKAQQLEDLLASATPEAATLTPALKGIGASCTACHSEYRD
ncbi:MAG: cytochrome c [Phycisphaerales bacterium]|nr:cytochrome c [Phycisphaerales bacterium]